MPDDPKRSHVAIETLAAFIEKRLAPEELEAVRRHLAECALCDLELKRLERFLTLDSDRELEEEARWRDAEPRLEAAFRGKTLPEIRRGAPAAIRPVSEMRRRSGARAIRWLVPAAAAAGFALFLFFAARTPSPQAPPARDNPLRGAPVEYGIALTAPVGEIAAAPERFAWRSSRANEYYSVEIFGADLKKIYAADRLADTTWAVPDSLKGLLKPRVIYLWNVKGYRGLERIDLSPNGWFKIVP